MSPISNRERPAAISIEIKSIDDTSNFDDFPESDILQPGNIFSTNCSNSGTYNYSGPFCHSGRLFVRPGSMTYLWINTYILFFLVHCGPLTILLYFQLPMLRSQTSSPRIGCFWTIPTSDLKGWLNEAPFPPIWMQERLEMDNGRQLDTWDIFGKKAVTMPFWLLRRIVDKCHSYVATMPELQQYEWHKTTKDNKNKQQSQEWHTHWPGFPDSLRSS